MYAELIINKTELDEKAYVKSQLKKLCLQSKEVGEVIIYIPMPGKLIEFLNLLRASKIIYRTHF